MDGPHLIYFADPMCSWCYGFAPVMTAVKARYGARLPIRIIMGGLRPGTTEPMAEAAKTTLSHHWVEIHEVTGQPFNYAALDVPGFIYDTDPAARAVVVMRELVPEKALEFLAAAQSAFYAWGKNITEGEVLAELAASFGVQREVFLPRWNSEEAKNATWTDYATSQRAGVTGFPTLVGGPNDQGVYGAVTRGYSAPEQVLAILDGWLAKFAA